MLTVDATGAVPHGGCLVQRHTDPVGHRVLPLQGIGQGAVAVDHQSGLRQIVHRFLNGGQRVRHLAVAIQLIAEHIGHQHHLGFQVLTDGTKGVFVALNDRILLGALAAIGRIQNKRSGDTGNQIGAGAVDKVGLACFFQSLLHNTGRGGLAIGAGNHDHLDPLRELGQNIPLKEQRNATG